MTWRGSTTVKDRIFACLPYLLPVIGVFPQSLYLTGLFPLIGWMYFPLMPLVRIYYGVEYAGLIIFFALILLVIRNERINHFIRFNTMQAIILNIVSFLFGLLSRVLAAVGIQGLVTQTLGTTVFLGILVSVVYSVAQNFMGRYAEIPVISDAVYAQVR